MISAPIPDRSGAEGLSFPRQKDRIDVGRPHLYRAGAPVPFRKDGWVPRQAPDEDHWRPTGWRSRCPESRCRDRNHRRGGSLRPLWKAFHKGRLPPPRAIGCGFRRRRPPILLNVTAIPGPSVRRRPEPAKREDIRTGRRPVSVPRSRRAAPSPKHGRGRRSSSRHVPQLAE